MSTTNKKRRFKKRYILIFFLVLFAGVLLFLNWAASQMTMPERDQIAYFEQNESVLPAYIDYEINGRKVHYARIDHPNDDAPLILMFHGSPGSLDNYLMYLADDSLQYAAHLIAVDRPGFGQSDPGKTERNLEAEAALFLPILEEFKDNQVILVGHSYGGPVIARLAMDYPDLVDGMVMVAGSIDPNLEPPIWWQPIIDWWPIRWLLPQNLVVSNQEIMPLKGELERMMPLWKNITAQLIVVQGTNDKLVPAGNAEFAYHMMNPDQITVDMVENGNHFILWSEKERVKKHLFDLITDFGSDK